jgi:transcriptional regulator with XRE-family HTH domain
MEPPLVLGRHIADRRRREGWTQAELARMLGCPAAWVSRLEQGLSQALPAAAGPFIAPGTCRRPDADADPRLAVMLRQVLSRGGSDRGVGSPRTFSPESLAETAAEVWDLAEAERYGDLAELLGELIPELEAAARAIRGPQQAGLHDLAASCYQACSAALARLGDHGGALEAADRALTAAHEAGDVLSAAASGYLLACVLLESGRHVEARMIASASAESVKGAAASGSADAAVLRGALILLLALGGARAGDTEDAREQLSRARVLAARFGSHEIPGSGFGTGHVALYEIAISIETGALFGASRGAG